MRASRYTETVLSSTWTPASPLRLWNLGTDEAEGALGSTPRKSVGAEPPVSFPEGWYLTHGVTVTVIHWERGLKSLLWFALAFADAPAPFADSLCILSL